MSKEGGSNNGNFSSNLEIGHSNEGLVSDKGSRKKKKIIMIASGTAIAVVVAIVVTVTVLFTNSNAAPVEKGPIAMALEDFLEGRLSPNLFNGTWISGNEILYKATNEDIQLYNTDKLESEVLLPGSFPLLARTVKYSLSKDNKYLLLVHDVQKIYRHSYVGQHTIVNLETRGTHILTANGEKVLQLAMWGPVGNSIVFVARNNIFYRKSVTSPEVKQITTDGIIGSIYNGIPDWVYEEEVFSSNKALWFSPDGTKLAYAKLVDSQVNIMTLPVYGEPGSLQFQYTKAVQIRYPKPGSNNPIVSLHVANLVQNEPILNLEPPSNIANKEPILTTVAWATNDIVTAIWMNRVQNEASIVSYGTTSPFPTEIIQNLEQEGGWLNLFTPPIFSQDGSKFLIILSQDQGGNAGSYKHITLFNRHSNSVPKPITSGKFIVLDILGWDEENDVIYYHANMNKNSSVKHIYSISPSAKSIPKCLSCNLYNSMSNSACLYNTAEFSKDFSNHIIDCEGPHVPQSFLNLRGKRNIIWENNHKLHNKLKKVQIPNIEKLTFDVADNFKAQVMIKLPPNIDKSGETKYPMLIQVYAGPDSFQVVDKYGVDWGSYLAANKSIIYAMIDGRGSGLKGDDIMFALYRGLGTVEIADQINVTRQMQKMLPYIDPSRTAIWGWSYGGFAAAMALATDTDDVFKCGMSVAPVTDWSLYDSIYTERFMGLPTPEDNMVGYSQAQLMDKYESFRDKQYFLIHGTLDDNVHYQQSMLWAKVLERKDILFRQMSYPDEDHSLISVWPHLYHSLENFLDDCFIEDEKK